MDEVNRASDEINASLSLKTGTQPCMAGFLWISPNHRWSLGYTQTLGRFIRRRWRTLRRLREINIMVERIALEIWVVRTRRKRDCLIAVNGEKGNEHKEKESRI